MRSEAVVPDTRGFALIHRETCLSGIHSQAWKNQQIWLVEHSIFSLLRTHEEMHSSQQADE